MSTKKLRTFLLEPYYGSAEIVRVYDYGYIGCQGLRSVSSIDSILFVLLLVSSIIR
jgi:hypothetical protein